MAKKIFAFILAATMMLLATACENPNASKTDKVGSYAAGQQVEVAQVELA